VSRTLKGDPLGDVHCDDDADADGDDGVCDWIPPNFPPVDARRRRIRWLSFFCLGITAALPFVSFMLPALRFSFLSDAYIHRLV
jgi:hypothetical protein